MTWFVPSLRIMVDSSIANKYRAFTMKALAFLFVFSEGHSLLLTATRSVAQLMSFFRDSGKSKKEMHSVGTCSASLNADSVCGWSVCGWRDFRLITTLYVKSNNISGARAHLSRFTNVECTVAESQYPIRRTSDA